MEVRINKEGISFDYHGDELLWIWPWKRTNSVKLFSSTFELHFLSLRDYWTYVGAWNEACRTKKVVGFSNKDILLAWAKRFNYNTVVVLTNLNVDIKFTPFWRSVDLFTRRELLKDVVVLFFPNREEGRKIFASIPSEFAEAYLLHMGELEDSNNENNNIESSEQNRGDRQGPF